MLLTTKMLEDRLSSYANPRNKIGRMVEAGELVPVRRGLYSTDRAVPGHCLASCVYGPSYLSFEYALAYHGLIPEEVRAYTSATCRKRKTKHHENAFGRYDFRDVPLPVYRLHVNLAHESGYPYWIASPEKALCDQLYKMPPVSSAKALARLLEEDLRIETDDLRSLEIDAIAQLAQRYHSRSVSALARYMERTFR